MSRLRRLSFTMATAAAIAVTGFGPAPHVAVAGEGSNCSPSSSEPSGLVMRAHPVILVHGWTGTVMQPTRKLLEQRMPSGWQFLLFDYHATATRWADTPEIAGCLADYIVKVSDAHKRAGGDGRVYFVAHSMGGLAVRFASAKAGVGDRVAGMVTLDTPHAGSPWGNAGAGPWSRMVELMGGYWKDIPEEGSKARRCMAMHQGSQGVPNGCTVAPYLPGTTPIATIGGDLTIHRTVFGFLTYDVPTGGDTLVTADSSQAYFNSAPHGKVRTGTHVNPIKISCTQDFNGIVNAITSTAVRASILRAGGTIVGGIAQMGNDYAALGNILDGSVSPALLDLVISANLVPDNCSHAGIVTNKFAIDRTAEALRTQASQQVVTVDPTKLGLCEVACRAAGSVRFTHPSWGKVTLYLLAPVSPPGPMNVAVVDSSGHLRWSLGDDHGDRTNYQVSLATPAMDSNGLIFINYDPGRYNGVSVLRPVKDGIQVVAGLYMAGGGIDLYSADLEGPGADGTYTVLRHSNDCTPSCAGGTTTTVRLRWNGVTFAP